MTSPFIGGPCRLKFLLMVHRHLDSRHVTLYNQSYNVIVAQGEITLNYCKHQHYSAISKKNIFLSRKTQTT